MDFHDAMIRTEMLFQSHILSFGYKEYSLETYADRSAFSCWKANEGCADTDEMRAGLNIDGILRSADPSEGETLTYVQYVLNIADLARRAFNQEKEAGYDFDIRNYTELLTRIREILNALRYDTRYVASKEFIYIVPHDPAAELIEDLPDSPYAPAVTEYRSVMSRGHLEKKRGLLKSMGEIIESYPDNLDAENAVLYSRIEFLLNHAHIREDNCSGEERIETISRMSPDELENWYDETYQLLVLRILSEMNRDRLQRVDALASEMGIGIDAMTREELDRLLEGTPEETDGEAKEPDFEEGENGLFPSDQSSAATESVSGDIRQGYDFEEESDGVERTGRHTVRNVVIALILADLLFVGFILFYFSLHG